MKIARAGGQFDFRVKSRRDEGSARLASNFEDALGKMQIELTLGMRSGKGCKAACGGCKFFFRRGGRR